MFIIYNILKLNIYHGWSMYTLSHLRGFLKEKEIIVCQDIDVSESIK